MNNERRKEIDRYIASVEALKVRLEAWQADFEAIKEAAEELCGQIEDTKSEEEDYRDNMPESLQQSERYYASEAAGEQLDDAYEKLDELCSYELDLPDLDEAVTALDQAKA